MKNMKEKRLLGVALRKTKLNEKQLELCYGGMLGDSSISLKCSQGSFRMSHCEKQKPYLEWKASIMRPYIIQEQATSWTSKERRIKDNVFPAGTFYCYGTIVHQTFTNLYGLFYETVKGIKRRRINMSILNKLTPFSMLIWFLDDGCYYYHTSNCTHTMYLSTYRYTIGEHQTLKKWLWHKWRIESVITYDKTHKKFILRFNKNGRIQFTKLFILPFKDEIPTCMTYKIPNF